MRRTPALTVLATLSSIYLASTGLGTTPPEICGVDQVVKPGSTNSGPPVTCVRLIRDNIDENLSVRYEWNCSGSYHFIPTTVGCASGGVYEYCSPAGFKYSTDRQPESCGPHLLDCSLGERQTTAIATFRVRGICPQFAEPPGEFIGPTEEGR